MWDSQSHKGRPIFGGWHKSSPNGSCGIGFTGFTTFVKFKMEEAWNSIVRWGPLGWYGHLWQRLLVTAYQVAPHGILLVPRASLWSPETEAHEASERILQQRPSEFSTNENTSWTTKWGFPKIGVPLFYHPFDRFSMK